MIKNIQMLRALASILVFFHHLLPHYNAASGSLDTIKYISHWGFIGVDVFFVISGFVICSSIYPKSRNFSTVRTFVKHRFFRIYSAYIPFLIVAIIILYFTEPKRLSEVDLLRSITITTSNMYKHALPVAWSLAYELYFYTLFATFFIFNNTVLRYILITLFLLMLFRAVFINVPDSSIFSFYLSSSLIEFFAGTMIFLHKNILDNKRLIPLSLFIIFTGIIFGIGYNIRVGDLRFLLFGSSATFIVVLAIQLEKNNIFTASGFITKLGDSSYTLYLSHLLFISLLYYSGLRDYLKMQPQLITEWGFVMFVIFVLASSHLLYNIFEKPVYKYLIGVNLNKYFPYCSRYNTAQLTCISNDEPKTRAADS